MAVRRLSQFIKCSTCALTKAAPWAPNNESLSLFTGVIEKTYFRGAARVHSPMSKLPVT